MPLLTNSKVSIRKPSANSLDFYSGKAPSPTKARQKSNKSLPRLQLNKPSKKLSVQPSQPLPDYCKPTPTPTPVLPPSPTPAVKKSNKRPSLSDQLAAIGNSASDLTSQIRKTHNLASSSNSTGTPVLATPAKNFTVGKLQCKFPSPINFFSDRCTYVFHHPFEPKEINMIMFYNDLRNVTLGKSSRKLKFKIGHPLSEFSAKNDYDHTNPNHFVSIELGSGLDITIVEKTIMPLLKGSRLGQK